MATCIATVGSQDFMLPTLEQAEQLLRILSAATLVDESFVGEHGGGGKYVLHKTDGEMRVAVKLANAEPIAYAEFTKLRDDAKARARNSDREAS